MPKFGPKRLPEILKLSQNFSLAESSRMTPAFVHNLLPETDNCLSWISGRERMTVENISWSISMEECCQTWRGLNPRPPYLQSDAKPTEPPRPGNGWCISSGINWPYYQFLAFSFPHQPATVALLDASQTGDLEIAASTPGSCLVSNMKDLIMKYFLLEFSPFYWFKKGSCQLLAKECAQCWLTA